MQVNCWLSLKSVARPLALLFPPLSHPHVHSSTDWHPTATFHSNSNHRKYADRSALSPLSNEQHSNPIKCALGAFTFSTCVFHFKCLSECPRNRQIRPGRLMLPQVTIVCPTRHKPMARTSSGWCDRVGCQTLTKCLRERPERLYLRYNSGGKEPSQLSADKMVARRKQETCWLCLQCRK